MVTAEAIFSTAIIVGLMLLFTLFVEWLVGTYILKRLPVGRIINILAGLLAVSLLVFGLVRQGMPSDPQKVTFEQAGNAVGLLASVAVAGGFVLSFGVSFISKRIGPGMLALALAAFFGSGVVAYMLIRPLIATEVLTDNDLVFVCAALALVVVGLGSLLMRPLNAEFKSPDQLPINPQVDSLSFGEKRRQRLNRRRARR